METIINTYRHDNNNITLGGKVPVKEWTVGVGVEEDARKQLVQTASLPFIFKHVVACADVHLGKGSTVGSVIATDKAIIIAAVGVDLSCGVEAIRTTLKSSHIPKDLAETRSIIEAVIPRGGSSNWQEAPVKCKIAWQELEPGYQSIISKYPDITPNVNPLNQLGTLGGKNSNHFIELAIDENDSVWIFLHSGSRGIGNRIGTHFINLAKKEMKRWHVELPNDDLAFLPEGSEHFDEYFSAVNWASKYAAENRAQMINQVTDALCRCPGIPKFELTDEYIKCQHNYVAKEFHFGRNIYVTRKGAISARKGQMGLIPANMGQKSYIVRGLGNEESFMSASHGAGRKMSRTKAKETFTLEDHIKATEGVECRKDEGVLDETPLAYKNIDDVMNAQKDLVEPVNTLKQILCIKG